MSHVRPKLAPFGWRLSLRLCALAVLPCLLSLLVAGCGSPAPAATATPGPAPTVTVPPGMPVTIAITGRFEGEELDLLDELIEAFEAANPDVRIEVVPAGRNAATRRASFASLLASGDPTRDIYLVSTSWLAEFGASNGLVPLDPWLQGHGIDAGEFLPPTVVASTVDGQLLALPWTADAGLLYYRRDLLETHGYEPPTSWQAIHDIALDIKERENLPSGFVWQGAPYESLTCNTLEHLWASGGTLLDAEAGLEMESSLQDMADLIATGASPEEVTTFQETATLDAFESGGAVFMRNWAYAVPRVEAADSAVAGKVGVAQLPASCLGGESLALSASSRHKEQALRFMAFLVDDEQQVQLALQGVQPPALEAPYDDAEVLELRPEWAVLCPALRAARPRPQSTGYQELSRILYTQVHSMLRGEQDAATTAANIQLGLAELGTSP